jgi:hypothetical protein
LLCFLSNHQESTNVKGDLFASVFLAIELHLPIILIRTNVSSHLELDGPGAAIHVRLESLDNCSSMALRSRLLRYDSMICFADRHWETKTINENIH